LGTLPRPRWLVGEDRAALNTSIDTTAGVTLFAIATNALLASAIG
jgi:hypothetical protein